MFIASPSAVKSLVPSAEVTMPTNAAPCARPRRSGATVLPASRVQSPEQSGGRLERLPCMVGARHEGEEQPDDLVPDELLDDGVAVDQDPARDAVEAVHQARELEHRHLPRQLARASNVREQPGLDLGAPELSPAPEVGQAWEVVRSPRKQRPQIVGFFPTG